MTELFKIAVIGFEVAAVIVLVLGGIVFAGSLNAKQETDKSGMSA